MPPFGPISRRDLIAALRRAGFDGPAERRRHQIMRRGGVTIRLPNPHEGDVSRDLLSRLLRQSGITRQEWERL